MARNIANKPDDLKIEETDQIGMSDIKSRNQRAQSTKPANQAVRKEAENSSDEPLAPNILTTPMLGAVGLFAGFIGVVVIWAFTYEMPVSTAGSGLLYRNPKLYSIKAGADGTIDKIFADTGNQVLKGGKLAQLDLKNRKVKSESAEKGNQVTQNSYSLTIQKVPQELKEQIESLRKLLETTTVNIESQTVILNKQLANLQTYKNLSQQGYLSKLELLQYQEKAASYQKSLGESQGNYKKLLAEKANTERKLRDAIHEAQKSLIQSKEEMKVSKNDLDAADNLDAPISGEIVQISKWQGEAVVTGEELFVMAPSKGKLKGSFLIDAKTAGKITRGDKVLISPKSTPPARYGYIKGIVTQVSPYPTNPETFAAQIGSSLIAKVIFNKVEGESPLKVDVELEYKKGHLIWTGSKGPPWAIVSGELADAKVIYEKRLPISYLTPFIKTLTGLANF